MRVSKDVMIVILVVIIGIFIFFTIFKESPSVINSHKLTIDSLKHITVKHEKRALELQFKADSILMLNTALINANDSLKSVKSQVKTKYYAVYTDINTSSNVELDSIIRSNWY